MNRKTMFLDGEVDIAYVPRANINEVFGQPDIIRQLTELIRQSIVLGPMRNQLYSAL